VSEFTGGKVNEFTGGKVNEFAGCRANEFARCKGKLAEASLHNVHRDISDFRVHEG